jgi:ATP-dependent Lon protease
LEAEDIRWTCPLESIPAETTEDVEPIEGIIGQDRALKALKLGVELFSPGYNIFVCGLSGTGKATTIKTILEKIHPECAPPMDYCYVYNFRDEDRPILLTFQRGQGKEFRDDMADAIKLLKDRIPALFEEDEFVKRKKSLADEFNQKSAEIFTALDAKLRESGFVLGRVQDGQAVHPEILVKIGENMMLISDVMSEVEKGTISEKDAQQIVENYKTHRLELEEALRQSVQVAREYQRIMMDFESNAANMIVSTVFQELFSGYKDQKVVDYLQQVMENILTNLDLFKAQPESQEAAADVTLTTEYKVNLVLDNSNTENVPVVIEQFPSFSNLFGAIERKQDEQGMWYADFTNIKAGALLRANGGYLVLNAADALTEPGVWKYLQRALLYRKIEIQTPDAALQQVAMALKPESIDLNLKVILIGNNEIYAYLNAYERDFKKIFKVKADFDHEMDNTELAVKEYAALVRKLITDEGLKHFDNKAIAAIVEYGSRLAGSRLKLTTQFSEIADIVREANYWCTQNSNKYVTCDHIDKAIEQTHERHGLWEDKLQEMIDNEMFLISADGARVGQINGLTVYTMERLSFGKPVRITATTGAGEAGIINIEREANLSGSTHDKGVLILGGYLREMFAQNRPLSITASISFEQSYSGIDGDSASSTEIYALLSSLSGLPIKQQYAVTGSVNQKGDIQPIGGVNEKIEGFFEVCRKRGLTGGQGVLIPVQNVSDLMLSSRVVEAVQDGRFHIHAVSRIEEGIEILTGVAAGARNSKGRYPAGTVFGKVERRLEALAKCLDDGKPVKKKK